MTFGFVGLEESSIYFSKDISNEKILTRDAILFIADLSRKFEGERQRLLSERRKIQLEINDGSQTFHRLSIKGNWRVAAPPQDLVDRRVEITGPPERKMIINALNSGANVYMADFEDSCSPTWSNIVEGQSNLYDAVRRNISYTDLVSGKDYKLNEKTAVLFVRPRGWHLDEKHLKISGFPCSAALFDFGLYLYHNAQTLISKGSGPYFYLPKLETYQEAALWREVFEYSEKKLYLEPGTIRATVLIETITAAFQMDRILHVLDKYSLGLNCGRWDYIFSVIKKFRVFKDRVMPDRSSLTMETPFLANYAEELVNVCHKRGAHAMGGMSAQIPVKNNVAANYSAMEKVTQDKLREVRLGHDGTWVAHPGLVSIAKQIFDDNVKTYNQFHVYDRRYFGKNLLVIPDGTKTMSQLDHNIRVSIEYLSAWLAGAGCVPIDNLMEDAATAEISRSQLWQWSYYNAEIEGIRLDESLLNLKIDQYIAADTNPNYGVASRLLKQIVSSSPDEFPDFLTIPAYKYLD